MQSFQPHLKLWVAVALLVGGLSSGCTQLRYVSSLRPFGNMKHTMLEATPQNPAVEILALWQPAEGAGANGLPSRGFAGQIFFFTRASESPVKVNGDVRVYVFDDVGTREEQAKPIHQFGYASEVWNLHLQDSLLGPSYQVFVPYSRRDPHRVNCTLSLKFTTPTGPTLYSKLVSVTLPGPPRSEPESDEDPEAREEAVRTAADDILQQEFSKFVNKRDPAVTAPNDVASVSEVAQDDLKETVGQASASKNQQIVQAAAFADTDAAASADDNHVQLLESQLKELRAKQADHGASSASAPGAESSSSPSEVQRFRLGASAGKTHAVQENSHGHLLDDDTEQVERPANDQSIDSYKAGNDHEFNDAFQESSEGTRHPLEAENESHPLESADFQPRAARGLRDWSGE